MPPPTKKKQSTTPKKTTFFLTLEKHIQQKSPHEKNCAQTNSQFRTENFPALFPLPKAAHFTKLELCES